jgi:hypothetical protein
MIRKVYEVDPRPGVSFFARGNTYSMLDEKDCFLARKIKFLYIDTPSEHGNMISPIIPSEPF